jgi:general secretion pathway protein G
MLLQQSSKSRRRAGFTLMEMLIVVAIIVALAGISVVSYFALFEGARADVAQSQVKSLSNICDQYRLKNKEFPPSLDALLQKDPLGNLPLVEDPNSLKDPWNKPYQYDASGGKNQGRHADIWTVDPNNPGKMIGNWPQPKQ